MNLIVKSLFEVDLLPLLPAYWDSTHWADFILLSFLLICSWKLRVLFAHTMVQIFGETKSAVTVSLCSEKHVVSPIAL